MTRIEMEILLLSYETISEFITEFNFSDAKELVDGVVEILKTKIMVDDSLKEIDGLVKEQENKKIYANIEVGTEEDFNYVMNLIWKDKQGETVE